MTTLLVGLPIGLLAGLLVAVGGPAGSATASSTGSSTGAPTRAAARADEDPLLVHIDSISPSTLSDDDRPITITGTVTNRSDEPWTAVNLYSFRSAAPIVDATALAASAATESDAVVGERIVNESIASTAFTVDELDPGDTANFSITVPRSEIAVAEPGVYWLGVHASGDSSVPRDAFADGRARTFIPLVARVRRADRQGEDEDEDEQSVDAAIVLPIRETVWLTPEGRIARVNRWATSLAAGGRLSSLLEVGDTAGDVPLTWLVDPAVPAAVARLAAGNPARSIAPDPEAQPTDQPDDEPTEEPELPTDGRSGAPTPGPDPFGEVSGPIPPLEPDQVLSEEEQRVADLADDWLGRFEALTADQSVLALPYGDLDVSAAAAHGPAYYEQAATRSSQVMEWLDVAATPALAPRDGVLSPAAIEAATPDTTILLADTSFAFPPDAPESMVRMLGHKVVVTASGASAGGPSPTAADDPLAIRQRLLSEAALRVQSGARSPIVLMLPAHWRPGDPSALFTALDVPWIDGVGVADISARPAVSMSGAGLAYTEQDEADELNSANFSAAEQLNGQGELMAGLLTLPNLVRQQVADEALMGLSSGHRPHTDRAADAAQAASGYLGRQLARVRVEAPPAVTLSSASGNLGADVVNGLDQPVTVLIGVRSDGGLELEELDPMPLAAGARKRIVPSVTVDRPGIHEARLVVTDVQGVPTGASTRLQVRAAQVSGLIWLLLAGGALLLFGTIAIRLVRRIRRHTPASETEG